MRSEPVPGDGGLSTSLFLLTSVRTLGLFRSREQGLVLLPSPLACRLWLCSHRDPGREDGEGLISPPLPLRQYVLSAFLKKPFEDPILKFFFLTLGLYPSSGLPLSPPVVADSLISLKMMPT